MKLKSTLLASALLSATAFSINAAAGLTPEQTVTVKPFDRAMITGHFNAVGEAVKTASRRAGKEGIASFCVVDTSDLSNSGNWRVTVDLYKVDAEKVEEASNHIISDIVELPKDQTVLIEPFDTVTVQGFHRNWLEINNIITKTARAKGAYFLYVVRQVDASQDGNQRITTFVCKKDAGKRIVRNSDVISTDSKTGRAVLTAGGGAARKVEIPDVTTATSSSSEVGRFSETQSSKGGRYTVTLLGGTKVEGLNKATATMMVPFDSTKFSGSYDNITGVSYWVARRTTEKDVKYYHITHQ